MNFTLISYHQAMKQNDVKRVAVVTSIGAGDSADQAPFVFKILMSTVMRSIFTDKNNQEQLFLGPAGPGKDLEFCVVRPGGLGLGPPLRPGLGEVLLPRRPQPPQHQVRHRGLHVRTSSSPATSAPPSPDAPAARPASPTRGYPGVM